MKALITKFSGKSRAVLFGFSPWLLVGVSAVLALAVLFFTMDHTERDKRHLTRNFLDRAGALIWALEAGTRTGMGLDGERRLLQPLIVETARQPEIVYMAVIGADGSILAHSDARKIGQKADPGMLPGQTVERAQWRMATRDGRPVFEVFRTFFPVRGETHDMGSTHGRMRGHGHGGGHGGRGRQAMEKRATDAFAFVAFERESLEGALQNDFRRNALTAVAVASLGLGGFISLFWAHNYRRSKRMLKDTQAIASEVVTNLPVGLITSDPSGKVGMCNDAALGLLRAERRNVEKYPLRGIQGLDWDAIIAGLSGRGKIYEKEMPLKAGGRETLISLSASQIRDDDGLFLGHLFIFRDIGEVKRLQKELRRNERLAALGNLAAGVAHEIRNPLSSIKGLATYLAGKTRPGGKEEEAATTMVEEVNRLNRVVSELLEFAKPGAVNLAEHNLNDVVSHALRLAEADIHSKHIVVEFRADPAFPQVRIDAGRVVQALLNLVLNAVQAMGHGGSLAIALDRREDEGTFAVSVADNGEGMPEETQALVFAPYFTTKPSGTGLGLAFVYQIMEAHGGNVHVASEIGKGSVFTLTFPFVSR